MMNVTVLNEICTYSQIVSRLGWMYLFGIQTHYGYSYLVDFIWWIDDLSFFTGVLHPLIVLLASEGLVIMGVIINGEGKLMPENHS